MSYTIFFIDTLLTLTNYELSRISKHVIVSSKTNIGVWVALLRVSLNDSYEFIEAIDSFPYFNSKTLPVRFLPGAEPPMQ